LNQTSIFLGILCLAFAAGNILADWKAWKKLVLATKIAASTSFLAIGILNSGSSMYALLVVAALAFSWVGDVLLVWRNKSLFLAGIAAFLLAHVAYAGAFATHRFDQLAFVTALFIWIVVVVILIRWLWKYLDGPYRFAVLIYMAAITMMVSFAGATKSPLIAVAAGMFAISDIAVARDRFVRQSLTNKIWGIPLYYLAQVLFAISVIQPAP
jgi:uncharacterized membrane protein YhhN